MKFKNENILFLIFGILAIISLFIAIINPIYVVGLWGIFFGFLFLILFPEFGLAGVITFSVIFAVVNSIFVLNEYFTLALRLGLIIVSLIIYLIKQKDIYINNPIGISTIAFTLFYFYYAIGYSYALMPDICFLRIIHLGYHALIPFYVILFIDIKGIEKILRWVFLVALLLAILSAFFINVTIVNNRYSLGAGGVIGFGQFYAFAIVIGVYNYFSNKAKNSLMRYFYLLSIPLITVFLFLTGTRGALVSLTLGSGLYLMFFAPIKKIHKILIVIGVFVIVSIILILNPQILNMRILFFSFASFSIKMRFAMWVEAIKVFLAHPIFGVGAGGFSAYQTQSFVGNYPHNMILEILSEMGLIGFLIFSIFIIGIIQNIKYIYKYVNDEKYRQLAGLCFCLLIFWFFGAMVSGSLGGNKNFFITAALIESLVIHSKAKLKTI